MSGVRWLRVDAAYDHHPDVRRAGFNGSVVFETLTRCSSLYGLDGVIPPKYADPEYLADVRRWNVEDATAGIGACLRVGLLRDGGDGSVIIPGWDAYQNPSTLRSQAKRERDAEKRNATQCNAQSVAVTPTVRNDTIRDDTDQLHPLTPASGGSAVDGTSAIGSASTGTASTSTPATTKTHSTPEQVALGGEPGDPAGTPQVATHPPAGVKPARVKRDPSAIPQAVLVRLDAKGPAARQRMVDLYNAYLDARAEGLGLRKPTHVVELPTVKDANRTFIGMALDRIDDGFTLVDLLAAFRGMAADDWCREHRKMDWAWCLRNREQVERFMPTKAAPKEFQSAYRTFKPGDEIR